MTMMTMTSTKRLTTTVPPKRGPIPQLNIPSKKVTTISEKINGRNRQSFTERKANTKYS